MFRSRKKSEMGTDATSKFPAYNSQPVAVLENRRSWGGQKFRSLDD
jgi:hypothetical protein